MRARLALLVLFLAGACHRELNLAGEPWLELKSDNFTLRTDVSEADARATIAALEETRSVYLRALNWGGTPGLRSHSFVVVELDDLTELHEFSKRELEGFVAPWAGGQVVVMSAEQSPDAQPVLKHELAHAVAGQLLRAQPAWFAEGLACFLENTHREIDGQRDIIGDIDLPRVAWLGQHGVMPAAEILGTSSAVALSDHEGARFESSAYEMFHMLFNTRPAQLANYLRALAHGENPSTAFATIFPELTPEKIDELMLDSQRLGAHFIKLAVPILPYAGELAVRKMTPGEVHTQLGALFELAPGITDRTATGQRARAEFSQALALDPGNPEAAEALLSLSDAKPLEWQEAAQRAVALHPDSWRAQLFLVEALRRNPPEPLPGTDGSPPKDPALDAGKAAFALAPDEPAVLIAYANLLAQRRNFVEGLPVAEHAVALDPSNPSALATLARQQSLAHRLPEALVTLERAMEETSERAPRKFVNWLLSMQEEMERELADSDRAESEKKAAVQAAALGGNAAHDGALTVVKAAVVEHDARVPIDRAPQRSSCPTAGPAVPRRSGAAASGSLSAEVRYVVGDDGKVKRVDAISGAPELIAAVRGWLFTCTFETGRRGGAPIDAEVREVFNFVSH